MMQHTKDGGEVMNGKKDDSVDQLPDSKHGEDHTNEAIIDVETYVKEGKPIPPGRKYRIKIDKTHYEVEATVLTGAAILALAGKTPSQHLLRQKVQGQMLPVLPAQEVNLQTAGIERFVTVPNEVTEGEASPRRQFPLQEEDIDFLDTFGLPWEATFDGQGDKRIVIRGFTVPDGYNHKQVDVFVIIPSGYPDTQIDMAYFYPHLSRNDGRGIRNLLSNAFDGLSWQGWSRHRTQNSTWRIGIDNLATHMELVSNFLEEELKK